MTNIPSQVSFISEGPLIKPVTTFCYSPDMCHTMFFKNHFIHMGWEGLVRDLLPRVCLLATAGLGLATVVTDQQNTLQVFPSAKLWAKLYL